MSKLYLLHHRYHDGSGGGVVPAIMDERERALVEIVLESVGAVQEVDFVEVQKRPPGSQAKSDWSVCLGPVPTRP